MRVHKINNVNKALDFIASKGVKLVSIGAEGEHELTEAVESFKSALILVPFYSVESFQNRCRQ